MVFDAFKARSVKEAQRQRRNDEEDEERGISACSAISCGGEINSFTMAWKGKFEVSGHEGTEL